MSYLDLCLVLLWRLLLLFYAVLPPVEVKCQTVNENPPYRVVNCKFVSRLRVPVCPRFACNPPPPANCQPTFASGGKQNEGCSWAVTGNCSLPTPVYPSRGGSYGFGYKVMNPGPVSVTIASIQRVGFSECLLPPHSLHPECLIAALSMAPCGWRCLHRDSLILRPPPHLSDTV